MTLRQKNRHGPYLSCTSYDERVLIEGFVKHRSHTNVHMRG
ncbi:hypothetical protein AKJ09_05503 [Labilithrix luteola]|uniref:Uncharacterized protein n=1 Tax=Labilithrix luteola TaxID=1391654 RepID=A0A0K1Q0A8_9BACT|nr:hypothetical protein AKJ09_05503 [Labilithrix luteola]